MLKFIDLENINALWLIVGSLAAWRLTNILHWEAIAMPIRHLFGAYTAVEDGHEFVRYHTFTVLGKEITFFAELWSCFWCLSVWVSILTVILILVFPYILLPFSVSAVAIIVERLWDK